LPFGKVKGFLKKIIQHETDACGFRDDLLCSIHRAFAALASGITRVLGRAVARILVQGVRKLGGRDRRGLKGREWE